MLDKANYDVFHKETKPQAKLIKENNFTYYQILKIVNKYVKPKSKILDIGCGAGTLAFYFAAKGNNVTGIDISSKAIKACKETSQNLNLDKNTNFIVSAFPTKEIRGTYDFIICSEVIEHLEKDVEALKVMNRLLKKNGLVFLSTPSVNSPLYKLGLLKEFDKRVGHLRRYEIEGLKNNLGAAGFKVIEAKKADGILRIFLFTNETAGKLIRFFKSFIGVFVNQIDKVLIPIFGESDLMVVAKKVR